MEAIYFTLVAIVLYLVSDWALVRIEVSSAHAWHTVR